MGRSPKKSLSSAPDYDHLGYGGAFSLAPKATGKIHYGADDNGSGTTALLELARRFGSQEKREGRRLVFMAFSGEESGLLGSQHYCKKPLFPLADTAAMVNLDMVGRHPLNNCPKNKHKSQAATNPALAAATGNSSGVVSATPSRPLPDDRAWRPPNCHSHSRRTKKCRY